MVIWIVIIVLILAFLAYLLWAPIKLFIDTASNRYSIQYGALARAYLENDPKELLRLRIRVFFMNFNTYPLKWKRKKKSKAKKKDVAKKSSRMKFSTVKRLIRSCKVKQFLLDVDTGDYVMNAKLVPLTVAAQFAGANVAVNFEDRNRLVLELQSRAFDILKSFINLKY